MSLKVHYDCVCCIRGVRTLQPHRLQTAMSLYSEKLSALILLVDGRLNCLGDNKKGTVDTITTESGL